MQFQEFVALVEQMRDAQRNYFKSGAPAWLSQAKELERRVDRAISEMQDKQGRLFEP